MPLSKTQAHPPPAIREPDAWKRLPAVLAAMAREALSAELAGTPCTAGGAAEPGSAVATARVAELRRSLAAIELLCERLALPSGSCPGLEHVSPLETIAAACRDLEAASRPGAPGFQIELSTELPETIATSGALLRALVWTLMRLALEVTEPAELRLIVTLLDLPDPHIPLLCFEVELSTARPLSAVRAEDGGETARPAMPATVERSLLDCAAGLAETLGGSLYVSRREGSSWRVFASVQTGPLDQARFLGKDQTFLLSASTLQVPAGAAERVRGSRLLLVADPRPEHKLCVIHLRQVGIGLVIASTAAEALERMKEAACQGAGFEAVLVDAPANNPERAGLPGLAAAAGVASPLVALSAGAGGASTAGGFVESWTKPVDRAWLVSRVAALMGQPRSAGQDARPQAPVDDGMDEIRAEFLGWLPERVESLERAFDAADPVAVKQIAHQIKGTASICGFPEIARPAGELESAIIRQAAVAPLAGVLGQLMELCRATCGAPQASGVA